MSRSGSKKLLAMSLGLLAVAEPEGYVRTFADEGAAMRDLLSEVFKVRQWSSLEAANRVEGRYLAKILAVKATGEQTGGAFGLIDNLMPAGFASPYHMHRNEDESFYVVEGEMTFYVGDERVKGGAGAFVFGPRGIPHGIEVNGTEPARILLQNYPAGFEGFPMEVGEPAKELALPPAEPPDMERLMEIAARYGIDILGPLPGH
jgi:quercetin dioxygenase-like cupin family protein